MRVEVVVVVAQQVIVAGKVLDVRGIVTQEMGEMSEVLAEVMDEVEQGLL